MIENRGRNSFYNLSAILLLFRPTCLEIPSRVSQAIPRVKYRAIAVKFVFAIILFTNFKLQGLLCSVM